MVQYQLIQNKGSNRRLYSVEHEGRKGTVKKTAPRKWFLTTSINEQPLQFPSRRAAFYFFEYGKRFVVKSPEPKTRKR
jgi:hypothetical protein